MSVQDFVANDGTQQLETPSVIANDETQQLETPSVVGDSSSILVSIKKVLGITSDYTQFDADIILQINSALSTLNQLGIGPVSGFSIEDASTTWIDFLGSDPRLNFAKTFVQIKVKLAFDPPTSSALIDSYNRQLDELTWRLSVADHD